MQGGCFYREELYHTREKCKGVGCARGVAFESFGPTEKIKKGRNGAYIEH